MRTIKTALATSVLAAGAWAQAADVSQAPQTIDLSGSAASFSRVFDSATANDTFTDRYDFTGASGRSLAAFVMSFSAPPSAGLAITDFSLSNGGTTGGHKVFEGPLDLWTLQSHALGNGTYHMLVSGTLLGGPARYNGVAALAAPVPEPATYGMLLGGLGVVAWLARRRLRGGDAC